MASTVTYELYGEEIAIASRYKIKFYCCNELTILRRLEIYVNDDRDENWNPEYDSLPDYRWNIAEITNFASDETTERHLNYDYISFTNSGFKPLVSLPNLSARPGQIMEITVDANSWSSLSIQDMSDSEKVAPGLVYSNESHDITWASNSLSVRATFDIYELLDDEILNFDKWNGYPLNQYGVPYNKGAWRLLSNSNGGFPFVALPLRENTYSLNEYLRENNQNIPLQRFLKETINGQTVYTPLQGHIKERYYD